MGRDQLDPATAHCCAPWSTERIGVAIGVARGVATCVAMANGRGCGWSSAKTPLWSAHVGGGGGGGGGGPKVFSSPSLIHFIMFIIKLSLSIKIEVFIDH